MPETLEWIRDYPNGRRERDCHPSHITKHPKRLLYCEVEWILYRVLDKVGYYKMNLARL
jgi:hypothetical protein